MIKVNVATSLANGVRAVSDDYDVACKRLLSERQILSRIMHDWLAEFSDIDAGQIERECLVGEPRVGEDPVGRDEAVPGMVDALSEEDAALAEGVVGFDVRFEATVPRSEDGKGDVIRMEMDVEAQHDFYPGYPLLKRAVFYGGRLLSLQGYDVIPGSHYGRVRKVVSIWVCAHPPRKYAGTVTRFGLRPEHLVGEAEYKLQDYNTLEVVMACLDDQNPGHSEGALGMLEVLLSTRMPASKKIAYLESECGIVMSECLNERVINVCNLSQGAIEEGFKEGCKEGLKVGRKEGLKVGRKEGRKEGRSEERARFLEVAAALVSDGTLALRDAAVRFGFSEQEIRVVLS